jgi:PAS domain S-box-containing protein
MSQHFAPKMAVSASESQTREALLARVEALESRNRELEAERHRLLQDGATFAHFGLLIEAATEMLTTGEARAFLGSIHQHLARLLGVEGFFHYLLRNAAAGKLELAAYHGVDAATAAGIRELKLGEYVCGTVARDGEPAVFDDVQELEDSKTSFVRSLGVTSYACFPLSTRDAGVVGTISFFRREGNGFTPGELALMHAVCTFLAMAWERRRVEEALRGAEHQLRSFANSAPAMLWVTDTEHGCTFLSQRWHEYTGRPQGAGLGFGWLQSLHSEDRAAARRAFLEAAEERRPFSIDYRLRRNDGEYRWVLDEGRPRFEDDGTWRGYVGSIIDVHERWQVTEALRVSESRYRSLFESIDEGFCVIQVILGRDGKAVDYRFLETNPAFVHQTGLQDAVGRTAREILPELEEDWFEIYGRVASSGDPVRFVNGSEVMARWFDVFAFRLDDPAHDKVALLFTDITDQRHAEHERERLLGEAERARAEAETANRTKAEFLAAMSHELRTPLNAVAGYVGLLEMEIHGPLNPAQQGALGRITTNQRHLSTLINDILSFARLEAGRIEFDVRTLSVAELVSSLESVVAYQAESKGIAYSVETCDGALQVRGDPERVRQILLNLVGNAIKFTPEGGWVVVSCEAEGEIVCVRVRDSGPGIAEEEQERIFEAFQQVGRGLHQPQDGVGLGLAISRDLARAMSGDLTVGSIPGKGSTFELRLPRAT